ncbi:MAG: hypothetical protein IPG45_08295 [Deltaproteobacteria bacterium]|nr:hypothetical protein [Deltaproteobacteria bacterium]
MSRADSIAGQSRRSLLAEQPSLPRRLLRWSLLVATTVLLFTAALSVIVLLSR